MRPCERCSEFEAIVAMMVKVEALADDWEMWSGVGAETPLRDIGGASPAQCTLWEAASDLREVLAEGDNLRVVALIKAEVLRDAADDIQALHPGETKNSVMWLRERAARIEADHV